MVTGILEIITGARLPDDTAGHWLFITAGLTSLSLSLVVLPHADLEAVAPLMGGYALIFGFVMIFATTRLPRGRRRTAGAHGRS